MFLGSFSSKKEDWAGVRAVLALFVVFNGVSLVYTLSTWEYNGDFYGVPLGISVPELLGMFVLTALPFFVLGWLGRRCDRQRPLLILDTAVGFLKIFVPVVLALQAYVTLSYGVGIIGQPPPEVGGVMRFVVLFLNRFQPFYLGAFLIILLPKRTRLEWVVIALMITVGLLRAGIGVFLYIAIILTLKYFADMRRLVARNKIATLLICAALPSAIAALYNARNTLRETSFAEEKTVAMIAAGLFTGRMSSLTNSAVVYENDQHFASASKELTPTYYYQQALSTFLGAGFNPSQTPQSMLINMNGEGIDNMSYMTGIVGELLIANHVSPLVALANLVAPLLVVGITFWLARQFATPAVLRLAVGLMVYPVMSGVPSEITGVLYFFLVMTAVLATVNVFIPKSLARTV